jgi:hypothetical protein
VDSGAGAEGTVLGGFGSGFRGPLIVLGCRSSSLPSEPEPRFIT